MRQFINRSYRAAKHYTKKYAKYIVPAAALAVIGLAYKYKPTSEQVHFDSINPRHRDGHFDNLHPKMQEFIINTNTQVGLTKHMRKLRANEAADFPRNNNGWKYWQELGLGFRHPKYNTDMNYYPDDMRDLLKYVDLGDLKKF